MGSTTETWFKTNRWTTRVEPVEVERSTDNSVWINGKRNARSTSYESFYPTKDEALNAVYRRLLRAVESAERELNNAKSQLGSFQKSIAAAEPAGEGR